MRRITRLPVDRERLRLLSRAIVVSEPGRCVQCGICAYNCPMGIDIRRWSRAGRPIANSRCILCGACVARCPRGTLRLAISGGERSGTMDSPG